MVFWALTFKRMLSGGNGKFYLILSYECCELNNEMEKREREEKKEKRKRDTQKSLDNL